MRYPAITVDLDKLTANAALLVKLCQASGLSVMGVSKAFCAAPKLAQALLDGGISWLGDSRIQNLSKLRAAGCKAPLCLLRLPMLSEVDEVVRVAQMSQVSELATAKALSDAAQSLGQRHKITLMVDLGDLREGVWPHNILPVANAISRLPGIELYGLGANFACYGGLIPSWEKLSELLDLANAIRHATGLPLPLVSGGNSANLHLLPNGIPPGITQLRLGESILLGRETIARQAIAGAHLDVFALHVEIIELQEKPSVPVGNIGQDAFGETPVFQDKGLIKRAIVAIGRQDINVDGLEVQEPGIQIIGASSDHLILDVTHAERALNIGSILSFGLRYSALILGMMSPYVAKELQIKAPPS